MQIAAAVRAGLDASDQGEQGIIATDDCDNGDTVRVESRSAC
jgi:hypothetical protein